MNATKPPSTNTFSHYDNLTNEWVTTITIRHSAKQPSLEEYLDQIQSNVKLNDFPLTSQAYFPRYNSSMLQTSEIKPLTTKDLAALDIQSSIDNIMKSINKANTNNVSLKLL